MATTHGVKKRDIFGELVEGVAAMGAHRKGRITLCSHRVAPLSLPRVNQQLIRRTRAHFRMSRQVFAFRLGEAQYEAAQEVTRRIAKEGRKYGVGLLPVSQRSSERRR